MAPSLTGASAASATRPPSNRDLAYEHIRGLIVRGDEPPGALLSENDLALRLELSRTPVREALLLLAQEGLVDIRPQRGSYVSLIDPDMVRQAQFIREAIEVASLEACIENWGAERAAEVEDLLDAQASCTTREEFYPLDEQFHRTLLAIAGHEFAWMAVQSAKGHLDRARYLGLSGYRPISEYAADHRRVREAIAEGNLEAARDELRAHLRFVLDDLEQIQAARPELFRAPAGPERRPARPARRPARTLDPS
ncbi:GntR family transcriptional regulator [Sinomonas humi]|uniref:GntR family transcriptional regulator n=1 Tax=Sinomonas humi TaxID=1338436 RepID=UPI00068E0045|nr:GntR family transcriptional regulator [Sinomonas humi]